MKKINLIVLILLFIVALYSHPHIWIEYTIEPVFSDEGLEGLQLEWIFDDMFSWQIIADYTKDQNFNISEIESKIIKKEAFDYLKESGYFANFYVNGKKKEIKIVTNFYAKGKDELLIYNFFIPWKVKAKKEMTTLKISFFDETIFCDIVPKKNEILIKPNKNISIQHSMLDQITYQLDFMKVNNEID